MGRSRFRMVTVSALLVAGALVSAPVAVAAAGPSLQGDVSAIANPADFGGGGVVWFMTPTQVPLIQPNYFVVNGTAVRGGFAYSFSIASSSRSEAAVVEVAINEQGRQLVALGTPTAALTKLLSQQPGASASGAPFGTLPATGSPLASGSTRGEFYTMWEDPLGLDLNEVVDQISWNYDGTHVTSFSGSSFWNWSSWNGWHTVGNPYVGSYHNADHTWATVYTNAQFETSSWFPLPTCGTSDTYYQANNVYGGGNGQLSGGVNTWATSGCLFLMHYVAGTHGY